MAVTEDSDVGGGVASLLDGFPDSRGDIPGECEGGVPGLLDGRIADMAGIAGLVGNGNGRLVEEDVLEVTAGFVTAPCIKVELGRVGVLGRSDAGL